MSQRTYTVLTADDHPIVRSGVRLLLRESSEFVLLAETDNAERTFQAVQTQPPDLLILDLWMSGNDGLELIRRISASQPTVRILVYSVNDELIFGPRAIRAGAAGYLMKDRGLEELLVALRTLAAGRRYLSLALAEELANLALNNATRRVDGIPAQIASLTDRELQILRLIGLGYSTGYIAENLRISVKTVGAHRENLKNKLGLASGPALAKQAVIMIENRVL